MKGYMIFYVTTANGSVPLGEARVRIAVEGNLREAVTDKEGKTAPIEFCFFDEHPSLMGSAEISCGNFKDMFLDDIMIYRNTTIVRIVNLDRVI